MASYETYTVIRGNLKKCIKLHMTSGDKGEAGEKGRTGDFGFPGPQVYTEYVAYFYYCHIINGTQLCIWPK